MKRNIILVSLILLIVLGTVVITSADPQLGTKSYTVKLYSAGNVVGTWQAFQIGGGDKQSVSFFVGSQTNPRLVTISGTFSVEQTQ
jgi:hypothetical protein